MEEKTVNQLKEAKEEMRVKMEQMIASFEETYGAGVKYLYISHAWQEGVEVGTVTLEIEVFV